MSLTPQEKKRLSYERDRRNSYGENSKSSRKAIPQRKRQRLRALRHSAKQLLPAVLSETNPLGDRSAENKIASDKRGHKRWKKAPDEPLAKHIAFQKRKRVARFGRKGRLDNSFSARVAAAEHNDPEGILKPRKKRR